MTSKHTSCQSYHTLSNGFIWSCVCNNFTKWYCCRKWQKSISVYHAINDALMLLINTFSGINTNASSMRYSISHDLIYFVFLLEIINYHQAGSLTQLLQRRSICRAIRQYLTHWGRDEMDNISQTTFSNVFSSIKMLEFILKFHWSLFLRVQSTIFQHWFR